MWFLKKVWFLFCRILVKLKSTSFYQSFKIFLVSQLFSLWGAELHSRRAFGQTANSVKCLLRCFLLEVFDLSLMCQFLADEYCPVTDNFLENCATLSTQCEWSISILQPREPATSLLFISVCKLDIEPHLKCDFWLVQSVNMEFFCDCHAGYVNCHLSYLGSLGLCGLRSSRKGIQF